MQSDIVIFGRTVPVYGLIGAVGVLLGMLYMVWQCYRKKIKFDDVIYIYVGAMIFAMIGAKLLYILQQLPVLIRAFIESREILSLLHTVISGGFVFYGGLLGAIIGAMIVTRFFQWKLLDFYAVLVPVIPLVHAFGRVGCFVTGCCYGIQTHSRLSVVYQTSLFAPNGVPLVPVQIIEASIDLLIFLALHIVAQKNNMKQYLLDIYILCYAPARFTLEFFRGDMIRGKLLVFSTSQWISILLVIASIIHLTRMKYKISKKEMK